MRGPGRPCATAIGTAVLALAAMSGGDAAAGGHVADRIRGQAIAAAHPPMEAPTVLPASRALHMREDDVVLGIVVGGEPRAYPWWIAKNFHAVNDTVGGVPVAVTFCEQCTGAAAFRRELDGRVLTVEVAGVYNGTIIARDRETRTFWAPFSGKAIEGPLAGRKLERIPLAMTRWADWKSRHPGTGVVWGPAQVRGGHGSWYEPGKWGIVGEMGATITAWDTRLPENVLVFGLEVPGGRRSYPLAELKTRGLVNDSVAGVPVVVRASGEFEAGGFDRRVAGRALTFRAASSEGAVIEDVETGSGWSADGTAVRGPLRGEQLTRLDGYVVEWHVWAAYNPDTDVFGVAASPGHDVSGDVPFPDLVLAPVDGTAPRAVRSTAEVNLVALWATWCAPCRAEMPLLQELARKHARARLSVVGIALHMPDDEAERRLVKDFLSEAKITFPNFLVDDRAYGQLEAVLRDAGHPGLVVPTVLVTDRDGLVRAVFRGREAGLLATALPRLFAPARSAPRGR
jgi:thiol-disulfide isomerase/thioredoxin